VSARPLRILFVHHRSELGGAPTSLAYLISELDRNRFEPHVYCPPGPAARIFAEAGATVHTGPVSAFTHIWASVYRGRRWLLLGRELALLPSHVIAFRRTLRENNFDLVHLNDSPLIAAAVIARRWRKPIIWHLRSALPAGDHGVRARLVRAFIRRLSAASIAINDDVAASFGVGSAVIPNPVDLKRFSPGNAVESRRQLGLDPKRFVIAFFGFIYPSKGFREFIQAAALARAAGVDAEYLIVGGAVRGDSFFRTPLGRTLKQLDLARNYEHEAKDLVEASGLADRVQFIPFTNETPDIYRASNIVVAPSTGPELGRPVLEAAASGIPVVASGSRTGGGVLVPDVTGVLLEASEPESLAAAIVSLLREDERRATLGAAARAYAEEHFDPKQHAEAVEGIYDRIATRRDPIPVLFVHHRPQLGGAPASLALLIQHLSPRFEAHVYCPAGSAAELFAAAGAIVHTGPVSVFSHAWDSPYAGLRWLVVGRELSALPAHVRGLDRLMRKERFPIVHLNDSPLLASALVAHRRGAKVIWHLRSALAGEGRDRRARIVARLIDRWGDVAIAIDTDVAARFPIHLPVNIIHNGVNFPERSPDQADARRELGLPQDRVLIGFAGFVRRPKGWPELVEAARILKNEGVPAHFVILGGGVRPPAYFKTLTGRLLEALDIVSDEESRIKELVAKNGLTDDFSFLAFRSDTATAYRALDIVTFPNQGVGLGRPVLEAAAYGKPVVASGSADGAGLLLPGVTGILLDDPTPIAIADALRQMIIDPELRARMGRAAAAHAQTNFDPAKNTRLVEAVYDRLLG